MFLKNVFVGVLLLSSYVFASQETIYGPKDFRASFIQSKTNVSIPNANTQKVAGGILIQNGNGSDYVVKECGNLKSLSDFILKRHPISSKCTTGAIAT